MAKNKSKRAYHKQDTDKVNKTALMIGGIVASIIVIILIASSFMQ